MTRRSDPNPGYWEQYGPFQHVKHELIRCYLNGWYPKLGTWARRVLYVDTHAGRGRYESGAPGSPVLAAWPAKPAATDVVAHATAGEVSATGAGVGRFAASARISTRSHGKKT